YEALLRNEEDAAVAGIADAINLAHAPRLTQIRAAREHAAVEIGFDSDDPQPVVPILEEGILADLANVPQNLLQRADRVDVPREAHAHRQLLPRPQLLVSLELFLAGVAVANARQPDGVVVREQFPQSLSLFSASGLTLRGLDLHVARAIAQEA